MAVDDIYFVLSKEAHQTTDGGRVDRALEPEGFGRSADATETVAEPAAPVPG
jgi:hypothetical protein